MPHGIMFHHFFNEKHSAGQGAISGEQLAELIEYIGRRRILSAEEWFAKACNGKLKNSDICLTFDDALLCQYEIALPVLQSYSISAFWFTYSSVVSGGVEMLEVYRKFRTTHFETVDDFYASFFDTINHSIYTEQVQSALLNFDPQSYLVHFPFYSDNDRKFRYIRDQVMGNLHYNKLMDSMLKHYKVNISAFTADLWMREEHLKALSNEGHIIGLHSHTHPTSLANLSTEEQKSEYATNYNILYNIIGERPKTMSHPCNSYNCTTLSILTDMGIQVGFRSNMAQPLLKGLEFPREDHINIIREISR